MRAHFNSNMILPISPKSEMLFVIECNHATDVCRPKFSHWKMLLGSKTDIFIQKLFLRIQWKLFDFRTIDMQNKLVGCFERLHRSEVIQHKWLSVVDNGQYRYFLKTFATFLKHKSGRIPCNLSKVLPNLFGSSIHSISYRRVLKTI